MITQKQWKIQHLAENAKNLSTSIAAESAQQMARHMPQSRDFVPIAEETRRLAIRLAEAVEKNIFGGLPDSDFDEYIRGCGKAFMVYALNAGIISSRLREYMRLSVYADELRNFALELRELIRPERAFNDIPAVWPPHPVLADTITLFCATSGGHRWYENAGLVKEIADSSLAKHVQDGRLIAKTWREMDMPFITLGTAGEDSVIVFVNDSANPDIEYAILADVTVNSLANLRPGITKPAKSSIPARDCWATTDGNDILFPNWAAITEISRPKES